MRQGLKGRAHPNWKGGIKINHYGYRLIHRPDHPYCDSQGYVFEHRLVVEQAIGKILSRTVKIHHVNGDRGDNSPTNLVACESHAYHMYLHTRERSLTATGSAHCRKCNTCGEWKHKDSFSGNKAYNCKLCSTVRMRDWRVANRDRYNETIRNIRARKREESI